MIRRPLTKGLKRVFAQRHRRLRSLICFGCTPLPRSLGILPLAFWYRITCTNCGKLWCPFLTVQLVEHKRSHYCDYRKARLCPRLAGDRSASADGRAGPVLTLCEVTQLHFPRNVTHSHAPAITSASFCGFLHAARVFLSTSVRRWTVAVFRDPSNAEALITISL